MAERRRRPELRPGWLTTGETTQYLGHSPSWLTPERLARLEETGIPSVAPSGASSGGTNELAQSAHPL
jgi:hypothetical protein